MIITQTPFRMSFFGGGTDMPAFFEKHGGSVISTTFDKYCYVNVRHLPRFFDYSTELVYANTERVTSLDQIEHPAIREAMRMLDMREIRLTYEGDLPARSGLGTSSSFAVGMLAAFHALKGEFAGKRQLAHEAIELERVRCKEAGGWQDQIAASFGGLNRIDFVPDGFEVSPIVMDPRRKRELDSNLLLFFTGFARFSSDIQKSVGFKDKTDELLEMFSLVDDAHALLINNTTGLSRFGWLLDQTWQLKRGIGDGVSTDSIDAMYARAKNAGALGGKLLGAGGGGFLLLYAEPDAQQSVRAAMDDLLEIPFRFEDGGTRVLYYAPEEYELVD